MNKELETTLNFRKTQVLNLVKTKGIEGQLAKVVLVLDYSGSMDRLYSNGTVQRTIERIVPIAQAMDSDGELDVYIFHHGVKRIGQVSTKNLENFVTREIVSKNQMGSTSYAPVMEAIRKDYGFGRNQANGGAPAAKSGGLFSRLFGGASKPETASEEVGISSAREPVLVYFITDGNNDNSDKIAAENSIRNSATEPIFWQFCGIGREEFAFLQKLDDLSGRFVDNADFQKVNNLEEVSDDKLYNMFLTEYPGWVRLARDKGLLR